MTSLSSMTSSSSDSLSVSSLTELGNEKSKVTLNDNYIKFIQSLKDNKKQERDQVTTDSSDSLLKESMAHPRAYKVFTASSIDLDKPQIL